jgi:hypothetical protein
MVSIDQVIVLFIVFLVLFVTFGIYYCFMCVNCVLWNYMQLEPKLVGISMDGLVQLWCSVLTRNVTWVMGQITVIDWNLRINSLKLHNWWNCYVARLCQIIHILCFTISFWNQYIYCQPKLSVVVFWVQIRNQSWLPQLNMVIQRSFCKIIYFPMFLCPCH